MSTLKPQPDWNWSGLRFEIAMRTRDQNEATTPGSTPVSGVGESVPLSRSSEQEKFRRDAEINARDGRAPQIECSRYAKRKLPHFERPWAIYAITISARKRRSLSLQARDIVLEALLYFHLERYELFVACIMPDHVHFLFQPWPKDEQDNTSTFWSISELAHSLKSFTAHQINALEGTKGPVWEEEVFDRYIRSERDLQEKFQYICRNPWASGVVGASEEYKWVWTQDDEIMKGSTPVSGVGESVSLSQDLTDKMRFGETPKPTPETGVLPGKSVITQNGVPHLMSERSNS
jgi:putative transposase